MCRALLYIDFTLDGCSPPSPLANGSISEYSGGAVGAMLTFQCDTGYMPQEEVTSTCLSNRSWVPIPECQGMHVREYLYITIKLLNVVTCTWSNT